MARGEFVSASIQNSMETTDAIHEFEPILSFCLFWIFPLVSNRKMRRTQRIELWAWLQLYSQQTTKRKKEKKSE